MTKMEKKLYTHGLPDFFPAQNPKYAAVILIEGGEYGGMVASPLFKEIVDRYGTIE